MVTRYFLEVAVYRCAQKAHYDQVIARFEKDLNWITRNWDELDIKSESYKRAKQHLEEKYLDPWQYNQVVGWLRLYVDGKGVVKAEHYRHEGKRVRFDTKRKVFKFNNWHEIEVRAERDWTSRRIFEEICASLVRLSKERRYRNRHIDLEAFRTIGPNVNWRRLLWKE